MRVKEVPEADRAVMAARDEGEAGWLDGKGRDGIKVSWHRVCALAYGRSLSSTLRKYQTRRLTGREVEHLDILILVRSHEDGHSWMRDDFINLCSRCSICRSKIEHILRQTACSAYQG